MQLQDDTELNFQDTKKQTSFFHQLKDGSDFKSISRKCFNWVAWRKKKKQWGASLGEGEDERGEPHHHRE